MRSCLLKIGCIVSISSAAAVVAILKLVSFCFWHTVSPFVVFEVKMVGNEEPPGLVERPLGPVCFPIDFFKVVPAVSH